MYVTHVVCDLHQQERLGQVRRAALAATLGRRQRWWRRRRPDPRLDAEVMRPTQEDIEHAFRF
jgi:hypothetical protein